MGLQTHGPAQAPCLAVVLPGVAVRAGQAGPRYDPRRLGCSARGAAGLMRVGPRPHGNAHPPGRPAVPLCGAVRAGQKRVGPRPHGSAQPPGRPAVPLCGAVRAGRGGMNGLREAVPSKRCPFLGAGRVPLMVDEVASGVCSSPCHPRRLNNSRLCRGRWALKGLIHRRGGCLSTLARAWRKRRAAGSGFKTESANAGRATRCWLGLLCTHPGPNDDMVLPGGVRQRLPASLSGRCRACGCSGGRNRLIEM